MSVLRLLLPAALLLWACTMPLIGAEPTAPAAQAPAERPASALTGPAATAATPDPDTITAEVDWFEEIQEGGVTALVLILLMALGVTFTVERLWNLRRNHIVPDGLVTAADELWQEGAHEAILDRCAADRSTLSRMIAYLVHHRHADPELLIPGASDIGMRELKVHQQKAFSLAVIAALAPLLGLLGTMIGMIESFKLVEQFGDDGGASMLAGSISKALITTALGLIIAIPALGAYHFLRYRVNQLGVQLDEELERLVNSWLLAASQAQRSTTADAPAAGPAPAVVEAARA